MAFYHTGFGHTCANTQQKHTRMTKCNFIILSPFKYWHACLTLQLGQQQVPAQPLWTNQSCNKVSASAFPSSLFCFIARDIVTSFLICFVFFIFLFLCKNNMAVSNFNQKSVKNKFWILLIIAHCWSLVFSQCMVVTSQWNSLYPAWVASPASPLEKQHRCRWIRCWIRTTDVFHPCQKKFKRKRGRKSELATSGFVASNSSYAEQPTMTQ